MERKQITSSFPLYFVVIAMLFILSAPALAADYDGDGIDDAIEQSTGTDYRSFDTDYDGIGDGVEDANKNGVVNVGETNPRDADTDDDGLGDGAEDLDRDGITDTGETDPKDNDSDNDLLNDGLEKGRTSGVSGGVSSPGGIPYVGTAGTWTPDANPSTTTNPLNPDTDGDGWLDGSEDANRNGRVDAGETNPNVSDDADHDGYYAEAAGGTDCDDTDATVYPMAPELCDGVDTDCDGTIPDEELDDDSDHYVECTIDAGGWDGDPGVIGGGDCDDADASIHPNAAEIWYDGMDQDCDGRNDFDQDQDGYVHIDYPGLAGGTSPYTGDCDDTDPAINPGAAEVWYDGIDQDCDGWNDFDQDQDGYVSEVYAGQSGGTSPYEGDCDDTDVTVYPMAPERCDGLDNDCDGLVPDSETDDDADGYIECTIDAGGWDGSPSVVGGDDCDDTLASVHPGATEIPNDGIDQDCDGLDLIACTYELPGDWDGDCKVNLNDLAIVAANWLVDCLVEPVDPACVPLP